MLKFNGKTSHLRDIVSQIDEVSTEFKTSGTFKIFSGTTFENWRSAIQFEMQMWEKDNFISRIIELSNSFNGWSDECVFNELTSKLRLLYQETLELNFDKGDDGMKSEVDSKSVFVVHGRNEKIRKSMFDFLRSVGLNPIEWDEARAMTNKTNPYIGDILTTVFTSAKAVIVLITPDDEAKLKKEFILPSDKDYERRLTSQARPNVIYEAGMSMGKCPDRTILIEFGTNLRPFSDISGMNVIRFSDSPESRSKLLSTLHTAGLDVNTMGKTDWLNTGDFNIQDLSSLPILHADVNGYYMSTITEIRNVPSPHYCYKIQGLLDMNSTTLPDESHWLLCYDSDLKVNDKVRFKVKELRPLRDFPDLKNTRDIYPIDLKKI